MSPIAHSRHGADLPLTPPAARRRALAQLITERGAVTVSDLAREVGVSDMTLRRDLDALEQEGVVRRSHGGAVPVDRPALPEPSFAARRSVATAAKKAIAEAAAALLGPREVIGLDVGSTVAALAAIVGGRAGLSVVTNSLQAITAMRPPVLSDVYVLGGQLRPREGSVCGTLACEQLASHWLTTAFIGVAGVTPDGLHDYVPAETDVKRAMMARAARVVVLADASKFGRPGFVRFGDFRHVAVLVTDQVPPAEIADMLARSNTRVVVAVPTGRPGA